MLSQSVLLTKQTTTAKIDRVTKTIVLTVISGMFIPITQPLDLLSQLPCQPLPVDESKSVEFANVQVTYAASY
jgi:hypothetical protein